MREVLHAVTEELRRLKTAGVSTVAVSDETLAGLRRVVERRKSGDASKARAGTELPASPTVVAARGGAPAEPAAIVPAMASRPVVAPPPVLPTVKLEALPAAPVVTLPAGDKASRWAALKALVEADPTCRAHVRPGKKVVLGVGTLEARIMFVGEAPGADEEIQGEPFVGPAGQLLNKMIAAMGLSRAEVYIGNIMNWRPQLPTTAGRDQVGNRPPTEDEMRYCLPYLRAQIEVVEPELLVALGSTAAQGLLGFKSFKTLGEVRGRWHDFAGKPLMVTYHPSYILREPTNRKKRLIWDDLLQVMERAALPISDKQRGYFLER
jgi:uracil-DNA glycosylase family 4